MNKNAIAQLISKGETTSVSIDPDLKSEISRRKIESIVSDMKKHLTKNRKVHIILVKE